MEEVAHESCQNVGTNVSTQRQIELATEKRVTFSVVQFRREEPQIQNSLTRNAEVIDEACNTVVTQVPKS